MIAARMWHGYNNHIKLFNGTMELDGFRRPHFWLEAKEAHLQSQSDTTGGCPVLANGHLCQASWSYASQQNLIVQKICALVAYLHR